MNDKILIDGINVEDIEKCEFCTRICKNTKEPTPLCKLFEFCSGVDCCYKQLKRKEQECEQYKEEINRLNRTGYCYAWEKGCHKICKQQNCIIKNGYRYKQALYEIGILMSEYQGLTLGKPRTMRENDCIYKILDIIDKTKEL